MWDLELLSCPVLDDLVKGQAVEPEYVMEAVSRVQVLAHLAADMVEAVKAPARLAGPRKNKQNKSNAEVGAHVM